MGKRPLDYAATRGDWAAKTVIRPVLSWEPANRNSPNLGPRLSIVDHQGKLLSRFGDPHAGQAPTSFLGPHCFAIDSHGDLYVGEVCWTLWPGPVI